MGRNEQLVEHRTLHLTLLSLALLLAFGYIAWLRRELAVARDRGNMYRDIAASLDREQKSA